MQNAEGNGARVTVSKAGVRTVDASEIVRSSKGQKAIRLMREVAEKAKIHHGTPVAGAQPRE